MPGPLTDFFRVADEAIEEANYQKIISSESFYFDQLLTWFEEYLNFDLALIRSDLQSLFIEDKNIWNDFTFPRVLKVAEASPSLLKFFHLIGQMVSVFDEKGYNAAIWNPYTDRRRVSRANLQQSKWTYGFIMYKLNGFTFEHLDEGNYNSFKNAVNYIQSPTTCLNVTSVNHRKEIYQYFFANRNDVTDLDVIELFKSYVDRLKNIENAGVLTTNLLYNTRLKKFWKSEVSGLMAADGTEWFDEYIEDSEGCEYTIIWNSGTPSGTSTTIKALRNKIGEDGSFSLFYKRGDRVRYAAEVIDFAVNDQELKKKAWNKLGNVYSFSKDFADYHDDTKSAKIVFLTTGLKKLQPMPISAFKFYKDYKPPVQHNLSPLENLPENIIQKHLIVNKNAMKSAKNIILYGPPGTGKTYHTIDEAVNLIDPKFVPVGDTKEEKRDNLRDYYKRLQAAGHICFTTFHQSYTYEDFIEGIKPLPPSPGQTVQYDVLPGVFKKLVNSAASAWEGKTNRNVPDFESAMEALKADLSTEPDMKFDTKTPGYQFTIRNITDTTVYPVNSGGNVSNSLSIATMREIYYGRKEMRANGTGVYYPGVIEKLKSYTDLLPNEERLKDFVIIIDEINRGNISQIFGELITLIEPSKQLGQSEELVLTLPYSKENFTIPPNVHIIGTMNTADRSVEALDTALRRRFVFKEMMPQADQIEELQHTITGFNFTASDLLKKLNQRIIALKDREHQIGHAYLIDVRSIDGLMHVLKDKIIPLLQEYFFGDYEKLQLVLGKGFVKKTISSQNIFAVHESEADIAYQDNDFYQLNNEAFADESKFKTALVDFKVK